jgi:outer membrane protein TolC
MSAATLRAGSVVFAARRPQPQQTACQPMVMHAANLAIAERPTRLRALWNSASVGLLLAACLVGAQAAQGQQAVGPEMLVQQRLPPVTTERQAFSPEAILPSSASTPLPINLATAMQLGNARGLDIAFATQQVQRSAALLAQSQVLWLPTIYLGSDYYRHDGQLQDIVGNVAGTSKQGFLVGGSPYLVFSVSDAIFSPLAARRTVEAQQAARRAATNDNLLAVAEAYFDIQQARGELAGALDSVRQAEQLVSRAERLAPELVPDLEVSRARTNLAQRRQGVLTAQNRWRGASAELIRVLHLDPLLTVQPLEPPQLQVPLVPTDRRVDELVPVAWLNRPELAEQRAMIAASAQQVRQEQWRPLLPSVMVRGFSTPVTGTLGMGLFGGGTNGSLSNFGLREDIDMQLIWQMQNLGMGNRGLVRQRKAELSAAQIECLRARDAVSADVVQAYALAQTSAERVQLAGMELKNAQLAIDQGMAGLDQTKRAGDLLLLVVRPQEMLLAIQALNQAYNDYYQSVSDFNRGQFRLYHALGQPARVLIDEQQRLANAAPPATAQSK